MCSCAPSFSGQPSSLNRWGTRSPTGRHPKDTREQHIQRHPIGAQPSQGGGAIKGIGETFQANLFSGTANHSIPIALSPGRNGFGPSLALGYSSGNGNGIFGLGWTVPASVDT